MPLVRQHCTWSCQQLTGTALMLCISLDCASQTGFWFAAMHKKRLQQLGAAQGLQSYQGNNAEVGPSRVKCSCAGIGRCAAVLFYAMSMQAMLCCARHADLLTIHIA